MIILNIDVTKIPKERIASKPEWKGKFLKLILIDKPNEKGDDGFIACSVSIEEKNNGVRGEIVGNWKDTNKAKPAQTSAPTKTKPTDPDLDPDDSSSIPF